MENAPAGGLLAAKGAAAPLIPMPSAARSDPVVPTRPRRPPSTPAKILVLATDRFNARLYRDLLHAGGYDAAVPKAVDRWIEALRDWQPDLILIDPGAPGGTGMAVARAIMGDARLRAAPVVAVTDASDPGEAAILLAGCAGRIVKPISLRGFFTPVEAALARPLRATPGGWARSA